jgi:hypothetical protein
MIDSVEIALDVTLEAIASNGLWMFAQSPFVVLRYLSDKMLRSVYRCACSFIFPVRVTVMDELRLKYRLEHVDEHVVNYSVTEIADANDSCFWIAKNEFL